ncbi:MAG: hypothetical protein PUB96_05100 [Helicobacteraceae bacterium]|nr:hypothetical protein [Helicobacteraceae bacterium]
MRFVLVCIAILFVSCSDNKIDKQDSAQMQESQESAKIRTKQFLEENTKNNNDTETPLKQELKKNLKSHLNNLSDNLSKKDLKDLNFKQHNTEGHLEVFENLNYNANSATNSSKNLQNALQLQIEQLEKLQKINDEISK